MELPRGFKGVWIVKEIWLAEDMSLAEKVIMAEIDSLDQKNGCFAKNEHFAKFIEKSEKQVSRIIAKLKDKGMITVTQENIKGTTRRTMRTAWTFMGGRGGQKRPEGVDTSGEASISNTVSNTMSTAPETGAGGSQDIVDVIDSFKPVNPSYGTWFGNKTERAAIERMLKVHGKERLLQVISILPKSNTLPFVTTITSPYILEKKWADLEATMRKAQNKEITSRPRIIM